ncbi:MAG: hypothetical protein MUF83_03775, partial [Acidimicrobiales bacterium]|nr:hypothetical protein [Acidimicrobiales bacterium]
MTTTVVRPDLPPPPPPPPHGHRARNVSVLAVVVVLVLVGGFFVSRDAWWGLRPTPDFPSLIETPDPTLQGTVASLRPYPDDHCIRLTSASGGASQELTCLGEDARGGELQWLADGRLQVTGYGDAQHPDDIWRKVIDPRTGDVQEVPKAEIPPRQPAPESVPGPGGEVVTTTSARGTLTMTLTTDEGTRTLLSVGAPSTYTFGQPAWNGDGSWFVVKDDLDRLLLVTTAEPSQTRVLVEGG